MDREDFYFVGAGGLATVVEKDGLDPDVLYEHFMNYGDEVFYATDGGRLCGITTPGDLLRYYEGCGGFVNERFSFIDGPDYGKAEEVFRRIPSIHEVAVVKEGVLAGVVRNGRRKYLNEWRGIREALDDARFGREEWTAGECARLAENLEAEVYLYDEPDLGCCSKRVRDLFDRKRRALSGDHTEAATVLTRRERLAFWGTDGGAEYTGALRRSRMKVVGGNGIYREEDKKSPFRNVRGGRRTVPGAPEGAARKIFMFGPCIMEGKLVRDDQTIPFYLQERILEAGFTDYEVVNCATVEDFSISRLFTEKISADDIVVLMADRCWVRQLEKHLPRMHRGSSLSEVYAGLENPLDHVTNNPMHCGYRVNEGIAGKMFRDIKGGLSRGKGAAPRRSVQDGYYIPWRVVRYHRKYFRGQGLERGDGTAGAVVMNCNPFTRGHRSLIEHALGRTGFLYVFVVEEDRSEFSFEDRLAMVELGVRDLSGVRVLASGRYIISAETFPGYFRKDGVTRADGADYDVRIFGEVVAPGLGIGCRFVGGEPFDRVTAGYNLALGRILPEYGVRVEEVRRAESPGGRIISASEARRCIRAGDTAGMEEMLPPGTVGYLRRKGYI